MTHVDCKRAILCLKGHQRAPHENIHGHKKKVCLDKTFPLGHFMLHFIMFLICQMTKKTSNEMDVMLCNLDLELLHASKSNI